MDFGIKLTAIQAARERIRPFVVETPCMPSKARPGLFIKFENLQTTGSFKLRGATNAMEILGAAALRSGVCTTSAGNHGLGIAWTARRMGLAATIYVPETAVQRKVDALLALGADVQKVAHERMAQLLVDNAPVAGRVYISPFANADVAAGQGTIGAEIAEQVPDCATVLIHVGGGGLSLGISTAIRALRPQARVYGVVAEKSPAVWNAWHDGRTEFVKPTSIADGLGAPIADLAVTAQLKRRLAGLLQVSDDEIRAALRAMALDEKTVVEPAGAAAYAAALKNPDLPGPVVVVASGGNVDPQLLAKALAG